MEQRKMKFRAWDDDREEMIYDLSQCETIFWNNDEAMFIVAKDQRNGDWNELEIMEFTGLRDKNGKDIYEGDILHGDNSRPVAIEMGEFEWMFRILGFSGEWLKHPDSLYRPLSSHTEFRQGKCEVIGNIHEHPHLLSGGN